VQLRRGELLGDAVEVAVELVQVGAGRAHRLERRAPVPQRVLGEEGDADAAAARDRSAVGLVEPGEEPQQRRLPGPVRAHDPDPRSLLDGEVEPVEHDPAAERLADGGGDDEGHR
jgi:hypothetical protein